MPPPFRATASISNESGTEAVADLNAKVQVAVPPSAGTGISTTQASGLPTRTGREVADGIAARHLQPAPVTYPAWPQRPP